MSRAQPTAPLATAAATCWAPPALSRLSVPRAQEGRRGGILKVAAPRNPNSLDPITGSPGPTTRSCTCSTTARWTGTPRRSLPPGLAESWEFQGATTIVLKLPKGVIFHDGTPFDAAAAKFNLDRTRTSPDFNVKGDIAAIEEVTMDNSSQITIRLKAPDAALLLALSDRAGFQVSPTAVQKQGGRVDRAPVGTGPFRFVSRADAERVVVTRNGDYWNPGAALLDGIEFTIIQEVNTGLRSVVAGENDFVYVLAPQQRPVIRRASNLVDVVGPSLTFDQLYLNYGRPPLNDLACAPRAGSGHRSGGLHQGHYLRARRGRADGAATLSLGLRSHPAPLPPGPGACPRIARRGRLPERVGDRLYRQRRPARPTATGSANRTVQARWHHDPLAARPARLRAVLPATSAAPPCSPAGPAGPIRA